MKQINQAREAQGKTALTDVPDQTADVSILYSVQISGEHIPEGATLFVFAKSTDGMPMPIAAQKLTGPFEWPVTVTLNDNNSLQPNRLLSQFEQVALTAIISPSGAIEDKQWQSESQQAAPNTKDITLNLKRQEP